MKKKKRSKLKIKLFEKNKKSDNARSVSQPRETPRYRKTVDTNDKRLLSKISSKRKSHDVRNH